MKAEELRDLAESELKKRLAEAEEELFNLRFQKALGEKGNTARLGRIRREIARIKTIQRQRELAERKAGAR